MNPYILELFLIILAVIIIGMTITQFVIPIIRGKKTWWAFRKGADYQIDQIVRDLDEEQQLAVLDKAKEELKKLRDERNKSKS